MCELPQKRPSRADQIDYGANRLRPNHLQDGQKPQDGEAVKYHTRYECMRLFHANPPCPLGQDRLYSGLGANAGSHILFHKG